MVNALKQTALLIDDEIGGLNNLSYLLEAYCTNEIEIIGKSQSPVSGIELINRLKPDILFLDIKMPRMDGFQLLEQIEERNFFLIFTTAHSEYGIRALKASAIDYLLKPIDPIELKSAVRKVQLLSKEEQSGHNNRLSKNAINILMNNLDARKYPQQILIPYKDGMKMIDVSAIICISADINYSVIEMKGDIRYIVAKTLKTYEDLFDEKQFLRIHKSHLVNINYVEEITKQTQYHLRLTNGQELPIARRRFRMVKEKLLKR